MLFNSLTFFLFLPISFLLYWALQRAGLKWQNLFLLIASYVFYGWWDWRFLSLIFFSSVVDFLVGAALHRSSVERTRKILLFVSLGVNLGLLGFFKYFNFFIDSFADLLTLLGLQVNPWTLQVILPVGISFYTFQTLSYSIDIYRRKIEPTHDPVAFFAFVSFFPQLVAGPIERASNLLPQFTKKRSFDFDAARDGSRQILWGFLKKVVVADNIAPHVDTIFSNHQAYDGVTLFIGVFFFAIQIYCDFSGYSDIAIGVARLFGFQLMRNFAYPYFSRDIGEFWRRWHISLSSWFRDYVYIPLGGSRASTSRRIFNIVVTFTVSGFWHGANWTFIIWGLLNGLYYIPLMLQGKQKAHTDVVAKGRLLPTFGEAGAIAVTFLLTLIAWVFFRSDSVADAFLFLYGIVSRPVLSGMVYTGYVVPILGCLGLLAFEWLNRSRQHGLDIPHWPFLVRWGLYYLVIMLIVLYGATGEQEFIYFQF